jgi:hypothetical protein
VIAVYAAAVVAVGGWMWLRHLTAVRPPATDPPAPTWVQLADPVTVPAKPRGIWTLAVEHVSGPALIKVEADGAWLYSPAAKCGPDGDLGSLISSRGTIMAGEPVGALIVKIGGSTAGVADGVVRVAGSSAVIQIDDKTSGPVFLTINDELTGLSDNSGELRVKIFASRM